MPHPNLLRPLLALPIALAGCTAMPPDPEPPSLDGTAWVLASLPGSATVPDAPPPTLQFEAGRAAGSDGCNRFVAAYTARGGTLALDARGAMTRMACPPAVTQRADAFMAALAATTTYRIEGTELRLLAADGSVRASFAAQPTVRAGTRWRATGINNGRGAVAGTVAGSSVTLAFDADGQASGSAGCNRFTARYTAEGTALRFSAPAATRRLCGEPGVMEQEQAFLAALQTVATQRREADRLELRTATGALAVSLALQAP